jgi:uncharacterized repeat protein (TIGR01451 family)
MAHPVRSLASLALLACAGLALGQPRRGESPEPPLADPTQVYPAGGQHDPDERPVERVQHIVPGAPTPARLPRAVADPEVVPAQYNRPVVLPAGELPTPVVTLNIEGSQVVPSGQPVVYKLTVRNVSAARAHNVVLKVTPPKNTEKVSAEPAPTHDKDTADQLWEFKTLEPGQTRTVELSYKPKGETDEVKIQARVQIDFGRGMITQVAPPMLTVKKEGPEKLVQNEAQTYRVTIKNTGRVTVRDIEVKDVLVKGLVHDDRERSRGTVDGRLTSSVERDGLDRTWSIAALAPGQSQTFEYRVRARDLGKLSSTVMVKAPGVVKQTSFETEVMTAELGLSVTGPPGDKGVVGTAALYRVVVQNKGSADLKNVVVRALFPPDMRPTRATNQGQSFKDSVQWVFKDLKSGEAKELTLGLTTSSPGLRKIQFVAKGDKGQERRQEVPTEFAGMPNPDWDATGPGTASVNKKLTYQVTVSNRGTASGKYELSVDLPPNMEYVQSTPTAAEVTGRGTRGRRFAPFEVPAGKKATLTLELRARSAGEARVIFTLIGDRIGEKAVHDVMTNVVGTDDRPSTGPPPATGPIRERVGAGPGRE